MVGWSLGVQGSRRGLRLDGTTLVLVVRAHRREPLLDDLGVHALLDGRLERLAHRARVGPVDRHRERADEEGIARLRYDRLEREDAVLARDRRVLDDLLDERLTRIARLRERALHALHGADERLQGE